MPGVDTAKVAHQHLLRAMDALLERREQVDEVLATLLRPLIDQDLSVVFYDLTTITAEGLTEQDEDVRRYGLSQSRWHSPSVRSRHRANRRGAADLP